MLQQIDEFDKISSELNDPDVDVLLDMVVQLLTKHDMLDTKAPLVIVRLEALSAKFAILARYYTTMEKNQSTKKNLYYTLADQAHQLAAAMKYVVR